MSEDIPQAAPRQITLGQLLENQLATPTQFLVNGVITSLQNLPLEQVLIHLCMRMGMSVAATLGQADLAAQLKLRKAFREAFDKGMQAVPVATAANMPGGSHATIHGMNGSAS